MDGGVREEDSVPKDNDQDQGAMSDSIHSHRDTPTKGSPAKETLVTSQVNEHDQIENKMNKEKQNNGG
ncbi:uncharacterized protein LOC111104386 isoform X2 [Crassostrea virginica]